MYTFTQVGFGDESGMLNCLCLQFSCKITLMQSHKARHLAHGESLEIWQSCVRITYMYVLYENLL